MYTQQNANRGFSLTEVIIAMTIFVFLATGVIGTAIFLRKSAEGAVREATMLTVAAGYMEQICSMTYAQLQASVKAPTSVAIPTFINQGTMDPLWVGQWTEKQVMIDQSKEKTPIYLKCWVNVEMVDNTTLAGASARGVMWVNLRYRWMDPNTNKPVEAAIRNAVSTVSTN